ncbi:unnamed protein product [Schistosoma spindalis]|nr:unnamed protein product [Schistosoma spindale]
MGILVGLSCWLLIWTSRFSDFEIIMKSYYFSSGKLILLISSIVGAGVAVFGYCIFNVDSPTLLLIHIISNFILILAFLSVSVCGFLLLLELDIELPGKFTSAITKYYGVNMSLRRNKDLTAALNEIQFKFKCCGTHGEKSSNYSWFIYRKSSTWFHVTQELGLKSTVQYVPESCCVLKSQNIQFNSFSEIQSQSGVFLDRELCIGYKSLTTRDDIAPRIDNPLYTTRSNTYLYEKVKIINNVQFFLKYFAFLGMCNGSQTRVSTIFNNVSCFRHNCSGAIYSWIYSFTGSTIPY